MTHQAKCTRCSWKCRADGRKFIRLASTAHAENTGHPVKFKWEKS